MGSTGRANGGVRAQFATAVNISFSQYTIPRLVQLDRETGGLVGFRPVGYLLMAGTASTTEALQRSYALQREMGVIVDWLDQTQVERRAPFVRADGILAATFCGSDGTLDPNGVASALCQMGRSAGCEYRFETAVERLERGSVSTCVQTTAGDLVADYVINAAGAHAQHVASLAGINLPVNPYRRHLACTEATHGLPHVIPMCVDLDTGVLMRREGDGVLLAFADPAEEPSFDTSFDPRFLDAVAERVPNRFPFLTDVPINERKCWAGLYPETPDHVAIIDTPVDAPWFIQCAGFGGHGIMHCLAAGQAVAELIRDGECTTFDLAPLHLDRFQREGLTAETAVL